LIQNEVKVTDIHKETLVLNEMETRLRANPMIRNAEVFVKVDGALGAMIEQRKPLGRVASSPDFYIDADGEEMPLSSVYTARVPLITGNSKADFKEITPLLAKIEADEFMRNLVIGLHLRNDGKVFLRVRKHDFTVLFGKPKNIDRKFENFKAFYQITKKDSTLIGYNLVNVQFESQVVATKKE
jgi:cell division protein FtsQ